MNAFFFGDRRSPLFGAYHPAVSGRTSEEAVLVCYPLGHEYMRVHRALHLLAEMLARAGFHVLRFDYTATGDSAGETGSGSLDQWTRDIRAAASELLDMSGAHRLSCVALRLGACVAWNAVAAGLACRDLVLWDPVLRGREHLAELRRIHRERAEAFAYAPTGKGTDDPDMELVGYPYPAALRREIEKIDLLSPPVARAHRLLFLLSDEGSIQPQLGSGPGRDGMHTEWNVIPGAGDWRRVDGRARITRQALEAVVEWLDGGKG